MKKEDCFNFETWDYLGWKDTTYFIDQTSWIKHLINKIHTASLMGGVNTITINSSILGLFVYLVGYNHEDKTIYGRYKILIDDTLDENIIFLSHVPKNPIVVLPVHIKSNRKNGLGTIEYKLLNEFSDEEISLYKTKFNAYIEIINRN